VIYPSESQEQIAFVNWFRINYPSLFIFAVPNGGYRNLIEANRLKQEGVTAGVSDLIILAPNKETIFIEFKKQNINNISKSQKEFHKLLDSFGFINFVAYGFKDAVEKFRLVYETI